jgi:cell division protein FtsQ
VSVKISIQKILIATVWLAIGAGLLTLLIAANGKKKQRICKDVLITIKGTGDQFFIDKGDIITLLKNGSEEKLVGRPLARMNLAQMELQLERSSWIEDAELYLDGQDVLHVTAHERQPIARVFTRSGNTFYIDSAAMRLPILQKLSVRVPVVTNFPSNRKLTAPDSALLMDVKKLALFIMGDPFWNAQIGQIDIVGNRYFELIPTVGKHVIKIGTAENVEEKFNKLFVFYQQVLSKTGFDKYAVVDVQYQDQVIGRFAGATSVVDSIQLQKNIEELMIRSEAEQEAQMPMAVDSANIDSTITESVRTDSSYIKTTSEKPVAASNVGTKKAKPKAAQSLKRTAVVLKPVSKPVKRVDSKKKQVNGKAGAPKAVMPRRNPI